MKNLACKIVTVKLSNGEEFTFFNQTRNLQSPYQDCEVVDVREMTKNEAKEIAERIRA